MTEKKDKKKKKPNKRDHLLRRSVTGGALAQDTGRDLIAPEGHLDVVVLNDLLVHLIVQNSLLMQRVFPNGVPTGPPPGKTPGGIILPGGGGGPGRLQ